MSDGPYKRHARDILRIRDDILGDAMPNLLTRELAMVVAKLEEAELWLLAHGRKIGTHLTVDVQNYRAMLEATENHKPRETTDNTHETV